MSDVADIVQLVESAYRGETSRSGWTTEADLLRGQRTDRAAVEQMLAESASQIVLALQGDDAVACALLRQEARAAYVGLFAVNPRLQAQGIGRLMLAELERRARDELQRHTVRMTVIEQRVELLDWYRRRGYELTTKTEPFPYGDPRFGVPTRDDLRFIVVEKHLGQH